MPLESLITDQLVNNSIFAILSVSLLMYVLGESKRRENFLMQTLKEQGDKLVEITNILQGLYERINRIERITEEKLIRSSKGE